MTQGNLEIARRQIEAANRLDVDTFVALASEDVEGEDSMFWSEPTRIYRGRAELREWLNRVIEPWESLRFEVEEMAEAADDLVLGRAVLTGRGEGSGVETQVRGWFLYWIVDGEIIRRQVFLERDAALEAAGLRD